MLDCIQLDYMDMIYIYMYISYMLLDSFGFYWVPLDSIGFLSPKGVAQQS